MIGYHYLPGLASNYEPPDFCLLSSWDYRHEPPVPGYIVLFSGKGDLHIVSHNGCTSLHSHQQYVRVLYPPVLTNVSLLYFW
jgi:hypothetical protein